MKLNDMRNRQTSNRAVSPVIGVILMVAITVILAAVIGAFVLEIGDQQDTAPSTSFDSEEKSVSLNYYDGSSYTGNSISSSVVSITIAGGENLPISQTDVKVNGNRSVMSLSGGSPQEGAWSKNNAGYGARDIPKAELAPPRCESAGTNEEVSLTSGEAMHVISYGGNLLESLASSSYGLMPAPENVDCSGEREVNFWDDGSDKGIIPATAVTASSSGSVLGLSNPLCSDDTVNVVWEASSGGKTQNLFRYTVQSSSDWCS